MPTTLGDKVPGPSVCQLSVLCGNGQRASLGLVSPELAGRAAEPKFDAAEQSGNVLGHLTPAHGGRWGAGHLA